MLSLDEIELKENQVKRHINMLFKAASELGMDVAIILKYEKNTIEIRTMNNGLIRVTSNDVPPSWTIG